MLFRLFFKTFTPLNITSIRIIEDHVNLFESVTAITALQNILSLNVSYLNAIYADNNYANIIGHLFDYIKRQ